MAKRKKQVNEEQGRPFVLPSRRWPVLCLIVIVLLFAVIRVRLLSFPLERDEGEYAYAAQLILRGIVPYELCYTMKLPGTAAVYALALAAFGQTPAGVHLGLLLVNSATIVLIYLLGKSLLDELTGVVAAASFGLLSTGPSVLGFAGHATQFVVLPAVGGMLVLVKAMKSGRISWFFYSGVLFGLAFLMKQPGVCFLAFAAFYLVSQRRRLIEISPLAPPLLALSAGALLPLALTGLIVLRAGAFPQFWLWTVSYARQYATMQQLSEGLQVFWHTASDVIRPAMGIWLIAAASIFAFIWDPEVRNRTAFLVGLFIFSAVGVCPGLYFRPHYFVLLLPAVALLCGVSIRSAAIVLHRASRGRTIALIPPLLFSLVFGLAIVEQRECFFQTDPVVLCRNIYGINPFPEALQIARFLKNRARPGDRVAVMGSEPEIYFYSGLLSATGYIYMYPLMEEQSFVSSMQKEFVNEIERAKPEFIVSIGVVTSWMPRPESDTAIWTWSDKYISDGYELIGVADILPNGTEYYWTQAAEHYKSRSLNRVLVYQKKKSPSTIAKTN